ncbi:Fe(3+) ABC transporter substrate-binding protein [Hyphomicrobium sulfonivorans]|uniref:Fe(3+) ABC transporter substrate-binding protein n=1 Tax=Hyphomicrobium sulfonivorans TaxID=121290 RepID=UPI00156ECF72|nr:Fe(3+) ABC transporter substrate-binding protein [Hyphomicrobium sulfonivorans]MBI1651321.1 Fe(3+) ABC transporter substrate-binding protein [Hyphomicrobium sulfonivorans]NSL73288.1 iron ABC transporter substrate-binding protein [Hyphomicrobium sulfonivorans]
MRSTKAFLRHAVCATAVAVSSFAFAAAGHAADGEVNIYSFREPGLIKPLLDQFTKETGIKVNAVFTPKGLIERIQAEGKNSPADLILSNDSGLLVQAVEAGVTQPVNSEILNTSVPAAWRDDQNQWFGLTRRARVVYASKDRVKQDKFTYEELADPKWRGKVCIRSGQHTYNIALIASMIAHHGEEEAEKWLRGLKDNLGRKPAGGDREAVRDVKAGLCDIAIGNTYYMRAMMNKPETREWAEAVRIVFPNADDRGTHVNVSGVAMAAHAPNKENAQKLMEFFVSPEAQKIYAEANGEYPVVEGIPASELVQSWGPLKADPLPLSDIAKLRKKASELVDRVQFDQGTN